MAGITFWCLRKTPHWRLLVFPVRPHIFEKAPPPVTHVDFPEDLKEVLLKGLDPKDVITCALELSRRVRQTFPFRLLDPNGYDGHPFSIDLNNFVKQWRLNPQVKINCGPYSNIFCLGCQALGIPARVVVTANDSLSEGHVVAEVWDSQTQAWFLIDVLYNCTFTAEGQRLSALAVSKRAKANEPFDIRRGLAAADPYTTVDRLQTFLQQGLLDQLLRRPGLSPMVLWWSSTSNPVWIWRLWCLQLAFALVGVIFLLRLFWKI